MSLERKYYTFSTPPVQWTVPKSTSTYRAVLICNSSFPEPGAHTMYARPIMVLPLQQPRLLWPWLEAANYSIIDWCSSTSEKHHGNIFDTLIYTMQYYSRIQKKTFAARDYLADSTSWLFPLAIMSRVAVFRQSRYCPRIRFYLDENPAGMQAISDSSNPVQGDSRTLRSAPLITVIFVLHTALQRRPLLSDASLDLVQ